MARVLRLRQHWGVHLNDGELPDGIFVKIIRE